MAELGPALLVFTSLALAAILRYGLRALLAVRPPQVDCDRPAVSILKPLKGADENLAENLESFFSLDDPSFEVIFGVRDADDPALPIARAVVARHPEVPSRIVVDAREIGRNPKVNNLANAARHARHDLLLVSDSNVRVGPGYLADLVAHLRPEVGVVSSLFRGVGERGLGGALEALQLNSFVAGATGAVDRLLGLTCVVGKSMLFHRRDLARIGGFPFLGAHLAEDQVAGLELRRRGRGNAVSGFAVDNVLGSLTVRAFARRHVRWAKIRYRVNLPAYAGEILLNPVFLAGIVAASAPGPRTCSLFAASLLAMSALARSSERALGVRRRLLAYPVLELLRSLIVGALWVVPIFSSRVTWRGNEFELGPNTRLLPVGEAVPAREARAA